MKSLLIGALLEGLLMAVSPKEPWSCGGGKDVLGGVAGVAEDED